MQFGTAIPLHLRNQYAEGSKLASSRDTRNTALAWRKSQNNAGQLGSIVEQVEKISRELAKSKRRIVGGFKPQDIAELSPFCIYGIENTTATDVQKKLFTDLDLNINDFTFQIASGVTGARAYINQPTGDQNLNLFFSFLPIGNFEQQIYSPCTDNNQKVFSFPALSPASADPIGTCVVLDNVVPTLICGIAAGSPVDTPYKINRQVVLNQINNGNPVVPSEANWSAAFWLEIIDDPNNGIYANLMGQMFGNNAPRTVDSFPSGSKIIPIGLAVRSFEIISEQVVNLIIQIQDGNLVNRWTPDSNTQRGDWTAIFGALPVGKTNLAFYPGDIVTDDTVSDSFDSGSVTAGNYYTVYQMIGNDPIWVAIAVNPGSDLTHWKPIAISIAP